MCTLSTCTCTNCAILTVAAGKLSGNVILVKARHFASDLLPVFHQVSIVGMMAPLTDSWVDGHINK